MAVAARSAAGREQQLTATTTTEITAREVAVRAGQLALTKKGYDIHILNITGLSSVSDYLVLVSGSADVQVKAIAAAIEEGLRDEGITPLYREGVKEGNWALLDFVDVVVHVFYEPTRHFYALEKLWADAPVEVLTDDN